MSLLDLLRGDVVVAGPALPLPYRVAATAGSAVVVPMLQSFGPHGRPIGARIFSSSTPKITKPSPPFAAESQRVKMSPIRSRSSRHAPDSLVEELELSAPAHDLVQTLVHEPVSALWVMRRPAVTHCDGGGSSLIARARSVRFAS